MVTMSDATGISCKYQPPEIPVHAYEQRPASCAAGVIRRAHNASMTGKFMSSCSREDQKVLYVPRKRHRLYELLSGLLLPLTLDLIALSWATLDVRSTTTRENRRSAADVGSSVTSLKRTTASYSSRTVERTINSDSASQI